MASVRIALVQVASNDTESPDARVERVLAEVEAVASGTHPALAGTKPDLIALPELWQAGAFAVDTVLASAKPAGEGVESAIADIAKRHGVFIHAGSLPERLPDGGIANSAVMFDADGAEIARYRKIHLFGFDEGEAVLLTGGNDLVVVDTPLGRTGLATCYDLRFPEQFRGLIDAGATSIVLVSGWPTPRSTHWDILTQARAVEEQAFFIACNGVGTAGGMTLCGLSRVVDPMGVMVACAGADETVLVADIDTDRVNEVRTALPVLRDRRLGIAAPD